MGASHHFLRTRRKLQNSRRMESFPLILELSLVIYRLGRSPTPRGDLAAFETEFKRGFSEETLEETDRDYHQKKSDCQRDSAGDAAKQKGQDHPGAVNETQCCGRDERGGKQQES